jgi:pimeloyl-ACP methyl ester carboxylesterase
VSQGADEPRTAGPPVVDSGEGNRPGLLVLDPAGASKHGKLPATWREFDDAVHVTWLRLPAVDAALDTAREALSTLTMGGQRIHLVASGEAASLAELLALEHPEALRSLVLVDPPARPGSEFVDRGTTVVEQALLAYRATPADQVLARYGVAMHVVTHREADRAEHGAPLPLGHPEVVDTVRRTLAQEPSRPEHPKSTATLPRPEPAGVLETEDR